MDRPKRAASKVSDYRTYHLSGDLDKTLQGRVEQVIHTLEVSQDTDMSDAEKLQRELDEKKAANKLAAQQAEENETKEPVRGRDIEATRA